MQLKRTPLTVVATLPFLLLTFCPPRGVSQSVSKAPCPTFTDADRSVSLKQLPANLLADQRSIWLLPASLAHGEHILPTIAIVGVTSAFIATDAHSAPPFRTTTGFNGFNNAFSSANSGAIIAAVPAAIYGIGLLRKDSYAQNSALLAAEALADGFLLDLPMKTITARRQPISYSGDGPYTGSFFHGSHNPLKSGGFYSGHAMASMAVATVFAHRYRRHRWVPFVAYGLAGAISFSRVTTSNHFPGDVVFGGAIGFVIARYAVLPPR
jgi:membrane-associated phospholipid phosphatase